MNDTSRLTIQKLRKLYKRYQNPVMALPEPTEYERGFDQALDLAIGIVMTNPSEYSEAKVNEDKS